MKVEVCRSNHTMKLHLTVQPLCAGHRRRAAQDRGVGTFLRAPDTNGDRMSPG
jgi:hypothetical protein